MGFNTAQAVFSGFAPSYLMEERDAAEIAEELVSHGQGAD